MVRLRVTFELFTYWNWGYGLQLELICKNYHEIKFGNVRRLSC